MKVIPAQWAAPAHIKAFTTTRGSGVSTGQFSALNLGAHVGDAVENVATNRRLVQTHFDLPNEPVWLDQVHGTQIVKLTEPASEIPTADAATTLTPGLVCCVMTADCMPLFLTDQLGSQVAVVHAGWRGMAAGIIEKTVAAMQVAPAQLLAWAGPTISADHFEVGLEVRKELGGPDHAWSAGKTDDKEHADLYRLAGARLAAVGVENYAHCNDCTYVNENDFFSHRRDGQSGRLASVIYIDR